MGQRDAPVSYIYCFLPLFLISSFQEKYSKYYFLLFFLLKMFKKFFFSNVQYYCKHHLFGSARSIILFFLYKQLPKPFKGPLYHPCSKFIITSL